MKKLLYATGNKYKIESMKKRLEGINDGKKSYDTQNEIIRRTI